MPPSRHSGARQRREPGIEEHGLAPAGQQSVVLDSGPGAVRHPGMTAEKDRVCMGIVGAPHGVRGAVRIKSFTDEPEAIARYGMLENESGAKRFTLRVIGTVKG